MKQVLIILPNQLFEYDKLENKAEIFILIEHPKYFSDYKFHKQKLIFHRASMKNYQKNLEENKKRTLYIEYKNYSENFLIKLFYKHKLENFLLIDPEDKELSKEFNKLAKKHKLNFTILPSPMFINKAHEVIEYLQSKKNPLLTSFYIKQRKDLKILLTKERKPIGGKWTFDKENRDPLPKDIDLPPLLKPNKNKLIIDAKEYIDKNFKNNPGLIDKFIYPINHSEAKKWLNDFLKKRFSQFGNYQDAVNKDNPFLFHSLLSPVLNSGLITPQEVLDSTLDYAKEIKIPINSLEGFIRQIIGWREYIRGVYLTYDSNNKNFWNHKNKLSKKFWDATTGIEPIDNTIVTINKYAYAHHIPRLMIMGNFMFLCEIDPKYVYDWFMELFIDAYEWVMEPNVYNMSQYASGGIITTKPYISSSNYILKMSNFKKDKWCDTWDGLYWRFIYKNKKFFKNQPRLAVMYYTLNKMKKEKLKSHINNAEIFLESLF